MGLNAGANQTTMPNQTSGGQDGLDRQSVSSRGDEEMTAQQKKKVKPNRMGSTEKIPPGQHQGKKGGN